MDCLEIIADAGTTKRAMVACVRVGALAEGEEGESARLPAGPLFI